MPYKGENNRARRKSSFVRVSAILLVLASLGSVCLPKNASAGTEQLFDNTLVCTKWQYNVPTVMNLYITKDRAFLYYSDSGDPSKVGVVYDFAQERKGMIAGVNPYKSSARINSGELELSTTVENRTCSICDGKTIMISDKIKVSSQGGEWFVIRNYRQWFPSGARAAMPSGSDRYACKVMTGRIGVGG